MLFSLWLSTLHKRKRNQMAIGKAFTEGLILQRGRGCEFRQGKEMEWNAGASDLTVYREDGCLRNSSLIPLQVLSSCPYRHIPASFRTVSHTRWTSVQMKSLFFYDLWFFVFLFWIPFNFVNIPQVICLFSFQQSCGGFSFHYCEYSCHEHKYTSVCGDVCFHFSGEKSMAVEFGSWSYVYWI